MNRLKVYFSVTAVTFSLLVNEIVLGSIFEILLGTVNSLLAISIALVGMSYGAIVVYFRPESDSRQVLINTFERDLIKFIGATYICPMLLINIPLHYSELLGHRALISLLWQLFLYFFAAIPFYFGGKAVFYILRELSENINTLYFYDLLGASIGCLLAPFFLEYAGPAGAIMLTSSFPCIGFCIKNSSVNKRRIFAPIITILIFVSVIIFSDTSLLLPKKLNTFGEVENRENSTFYISRDDLDFSQWSTDAWTIVRSEGIPQQWRNFRGWGISDKYKGNIPEIKMVNYNSRFSSYITAFDGNFDKLKDWLNFDLVSMHFQLGRKYKQVVNIGSGGGREILSALNHGAESVKAVDINKAVIASIMEDKYREFSGNLYLRDDVEAIIDDGRSYLSRHNGDIDLIEFSIVGGAAIEKMDLMTSNLLFTREALKIYLSKLNSTGVLSYTMYGHGSRHILNSISNESIPFVPYAPPLKVLSGLKNIFEEKSEQGDFRNHVLIAGLPGVIHPDYDLIHIMVSKNGWSDAEISLFRNLSEKIGVLLYFPISRDTSNNIYSILLDSKNLDQLSKRLPFNTHFNTDDNPFYFSSNFTSNREETYLISTLKNLIKSPLIMNGIFFLILSILIFSIPFFLNSKSPIHRGMYSSFIPIFIYFSFLGLGYVFLEMTLIYRIQVYLGRPLYSLTTALFAFLFASSLGSYFSRKMILKDVLWKLVWMTLISAAFFVWVGGFIMEVTSNQTLLVRGIIVIALIFPVALPMGAFLPLGVREVEKNAKGTVPLIFALNGVMSVFALFGVRIAVLMAGVSFALGLAMILYLVCGFTGAKLTLSEGKTKY